MSEIEIPIRDLLNSQAGRVGWDELARHFARGVVVCVAAGEDLIAVAEGFVADQADDLAERYEAGRLHRALDDDARRWARDGAEFWAVVVAPWVLVQEIADSE